MPPTANGIADYAYEVVKALATEYRSIVFCDDPFAKIPSGIALADPLQAFRFLDEQACPIYQIGNNWGHADIYRAAIATPGIVVLHDIKLLYLNEGLQRAPAEYAALLVKSNRHLARVRATDIAYRRRTVRSDYLLFDMTSELLERSSAVVVHSRFAKALIERHYGPNVSRKVHVTPHFAFDVPHEPREAARQRLGIDPDYFVVTTCGFATRSKRYDWLIQALDRLAASRRKIIWVQAGPLRKEEYDLEAEVEESPRVKAIARFTGFLTEQDLNGYIAASDVIVNLRFPSVGESSGILSRALPAGACCLVADTAGYAEYPDDVVVKVPLADPPGSIAAALMGLIDSPDAKQAFGDNARKFARAALSLDTYKSTLDELIAQVMSAGGRAASGKKCAAADAGPDEPIIVPAGAFGSTSRLGAPGNHVSVRIGPLETHQLASRSLEDLVPPGIALQNAALVTNTAGNRNVAASKGGVFLQIAGVIVS